MIESNSQKTFYSVVLYTNMAAVTSDGNPQLANIKNTMILFICPSKILHSFPVSLGIVISPKG